MSDVPVYTVGPRVVILAALSDSLARKGYPPTIPEIGKATGIPVATVHDYLVRLRAEGYVTWTEGRERTLRFVRDTVSAPGGSREV